MSGEEPRVDSHQLPSLAGPLGKLHRAHVHLRELYGELNTYTAEQRHRVISDHTEVAGDRIYKMSLEVIEPLGNPGWGLLVGDFVHNLRASLDHLVWQLVLLNGKQPSRSNQFPICSSRERYWGSSGGQHSIRERTLAGVAAGHREKIDSVQPFCAPFPNALDCEFHVLAVLARLSNVDKHQLIMSALVSIGEVDPGMFDISTADGSGVAMIELQQHALFADRTEIGTVRMRGVTPGVGVKIDINLPLEIGFGYPKGVGSDGLGMMYEFVRDLVKGFAGDFAEAKVS